MKLSTTAKILTNWPPEKRTVPGTNKVFKSKHLVLSTDAGILGFDITSPLIIAQTETIKTGTSVNIEFELSSKHNNRKAGHYYPVLKLRKIKQL